MFKKLAMALSIVLVLTFSIVSRVEFAFAQEAAVDPAAKAESVSMTKEGYVSLDFQEADIRNVLQILSYKSGVNIVAGPEVTGLVTIQLNDVPWLEALEVVLQTYGYAYERKGSIITVTNIENMKKRREDAVLLAEQEPLETRTFTLNFGKASKVIESVGKMKSERGHVDFDDRTNTIIATDIHQRLNLIAKVIKDLDTTTPQVLIEAKIIETTISNTENLGIDWTTKVTVSGSKIPSTFPFNLPSENKYLGGVDFPATSTSDFSYGTLNFAQVTAVMEFLKTKSDTNVLSNPRIVTTDNQKASIVVGSQYPIPTYTYNEDQAKLQVSGWEYKDIGIIFDVTPHVNRAGFVTIDIEPKITAILDFVTVENTSLPRLSNETAKTSVMIKDGETLVIGGLLKDQTTDTKKRTPFLGDVPILGLAFQKKEKSLSKTDLMLFMTPHIITPEIPGEEATN